MRSQRTLFLSCVLLFLTLVGLLTNLSQDMRVYAQPDPSKTGEAGSGTEDNGTSEVVGGFIINTLAPIDSVTRPASEGLPLIDVCAIAPLSATSTLNVRDLASTSGNIIGTITQYRWYDATEGVYDDGRGNVWYRVEADNGQEGYANYSRNVNGEIVTNSQRSTWCTALTPPNCPEFQDSADVIDLPEFAQVIYEQNCPVLADIAEDRSQGFGSDGIERKDGLEDDCPSRLAALILILTNFSPDRQVEIIAAINAALENGEDACALIQSILDDYTRGIVPGDPTPQVTETPEMTETPVATDEPTPTVTPSVTSPIPASPATPGPTLIGVLATWNPPVELTEERREEVTEQATAETTAESANESPTPPEATEIPSITSGEVIRDIAPNQQVIQGMFIVSDPQNGAFNVHIFEYGKPANLAPYLPEKSFLPSLNLKRQFIAYLVQTGDSMSLEVMNGRNRSQNNVLDGEQLLTAGYRIEPEPVVWSPDGTVMLVTMTHIESGETGIYEVKPTTPDVYTLRFNKARKPAYNPQNYFIAYENLETNGITIYQVRDETAQPPVSYDLPVPVDCDHLSDPVFDYRYHLLFFCHKVDGQRVLRGTDDKDNIREINIAVGTDIHNLSPLPEDYWTFDDGEQVYFVSIQWGIDQAAITLNQRLRIEGLPEGQEFHVTQLGWGLASPEDD